MNEEEFIEKVSKCYEVAPLAEGASKSPEIKGQTNLYIGNKWYSCVIKNEFLDLNDPVNSLDTQMMTNYIFRDILGITNIRTDD